MANLIVTFGKHAEDVALEEAEGSRTELIVIGAQNAEGTLTASASDTLVTVRAESNCWVAIAKKYRNPSSNMRRYVAANTEKQFAVGQGVKVAVVAA